MEKETSPLWVKDIDNILKKTGFDASGVDILSVNGNNNTRPQTYAEKLRDRQETFPLYGALAGACLGAASTFFLSEPLNLDKGLFIGAASLGFKLFFLTPLGGVVGATVGSVTGWAASKTVEKIESRFNS